MTSSLSLKTLLRPRLAWALRWGLLVLAMACAVRTPLPLALVQPPVGPATVGSALPAPELSAAATLPQRRGLVVPVDRQTFKLAIRDEQVWKAALEVLLRNYNLTVVDRASGVISTEWDSFYLGNRVYRNRVSLRISGLSYRASQMTIFNHVEELADASTASPGTMGPVWLPSTEGGGEVERIVRNVAAALGEVSAPAPPDPRQEAVSSGESPVSLGS